MSGTGGTSFVIAFMALGCFLTVIFFVAMALVVVGHFKPSARMQRAGWMVLAVWVIPAAIWLYYLGVVIRSRPDLRSSSEQEIAQSSERLGAVADQHLAL